MSERASSPTDHDLLIRIDEAVRQIRERQTESDSVIGDLDTRITAVERWRWVITGGLIALAMVSQPIQAIAATVTAGK